MQTIRIIDELKLIYFEPEEFFTTESVIEYMEVLDKYEVNVSQYKRFVNLFKIKSANFKYNEIKDIVSIIKVFRAQNRKIKTCIYCKNLGIEKMATLFITKMKPEFENYFATESLDECAKYLDIDIDVLKEI